jgi:hypothetical protein
VGRTGRTVASGVARAKPAGTFTGPAENVDSTLGAGLAQHGHVTQLASHAPSGAQQSRLSSQDAKGGSRTFAAWGPMSRATRTTRTRRIIE